MMQQPTTIPTTAEGNGFSAYPDDGHIFVCVRVRDVPQNACLSAIAASTSNTFNCSNNGGLSGQSRKTTLREAQKICISTLENIVIMHDPKGLDDPSTVARDANNIVQLLTDRANAAAGGSAGVNGVRPSTRPSTRKSTGTGGRTRSSTGAGKRNTTSTGTGGSRGLIGTQTASYYECDQCVSSMDEVSMLKMPMIKNSDFLQPPAYGTQEDVYLSTAGHAVAAAVEGINSCVFTYGQTGSGKTYTLFGDTTNIRRDPGVVPRTLDDLFGKLEAIKASHGANAETDYTYSVSLSFFEIYQNEVYCLFSRQGPLHVQFMRDPSGRKETMIISDLQQQVVTSAEKAYPLIEMGLRRRQTGETGMNARSSRSHAVLQVRVTQWHTNRETRETVEHNATVNLVDLAGSERQRTANTQGKNREEGIQINQSLATLARVINDIASGAKFINYRDSLLTMVLKDNLGGNSKTFMIATVSPIAFSYQESCATLTYAKDVRRIRNRPVVNRTFQTKANLLEQNSRLKSENEKLREQMEEWMLRWNRPGVGGVGGGGMGLPDDISAISVSPDATPSHREALADFHPSALTAYKGSRGTMYDGAAVLGNTEVLVAATSTSGLTAPLVLSSHRRYTNIAGIGGSCVEGGVFRVTSLVEETARLHLADIIAQGRDGKDSNRNRKDSSGEGEEGATPVANKETVVMMMEDESPTTAFLRDPLAQNTDVFHNQSGEFDLLAGIHTPPDQRHTTTTTNTVDSSTVKEAEHGDDETASPSISARHTAVHATTTTATADLTSRHDFGYVEFERVGLRSCEQRFYVHYVPPQDDTAACRAIVDIQVNGKSIGTADRREMHHGDVLCAFLENIEEDGSNTSNNKSGGQSLLCFHYVDLSCLSRGSSSARPHPTLGQLAVSVDLPSKMESLTLDDIQQLQRDRDKLLDLVQQQKQTIEYQCQQQKLHRGLSFVSSVSPSPDMSRGSPEPRGLDRSPSLAIAVTPALAKKAALEAFKRSSISPSCGLRARSTLPADIENEALLRRAEEQSQSQARLDGAIDENKQLHRAVANRNATLQALAKRLAELEAGGSPSMPRHDGSSKSNSDKSDADSWSSPMHTGGGGGDDDGASCASHTTITVSPQAPLRSLTRVSVSSTKFGEDDEEFMAAKAPAAAPAGGEVISTLLPILRAQEIELPATQAKAFYESTEGARERYVAAVRESALNAHIAELEALLADLRAQLGTQESRLRVSRDDTLEQQMLREEAERERDALLRELAALRGETDQLQRENESLEAFLKRSEEALATALAMNDEELMQRAGVLSKQIRALKALALLWKRRAMKYIAMGYGDAEQVCRPEQIPWDDLRYGVTAEVAKAALKQRGLLSDEASDAVDNFEKTTAVESVLALEAVLQDLEDENRRLQGEIARYEAALQELKDLIDRLKRERDALEKEMQDSAAMDGEERARLQRMLDCTNHDLTEAEANSRKVQQQLQDRVQQSKDNALRTSKKHDQLLAEQRQKMHELEGKAEQLKDSVLAKDEELRTLLRYMEDSGMVGIDGAVRDMELRSRIEDLIGHAMKGYDAPTGYSVFPSDFHFSEEMVALIRVCLRMLLDRLKVELYVLNKQNLHKLSLLAPTVQLRPEAQFHTFMHELRGVATEVSGRTQRIGGKWSLSEADVLSDLVDHRRRRAGGALYGLLIWYDHWDLSHKSEHVSYIELIRNADRIMQMARQVRQESLLNTNATSTLLMPIPSKCGKSESAYVTNSSRTKDKTVAESRRILGRLSHDNRRSHLGAALSDAAPPSKEDKENRPFSRTATALALSQNMPYSRTAPAAQALGGGGGAAAATHALPGVSPAKPPRPTTAGSGAAPPLPTQLPLPLPVPTASANVASTAAVAGGGSTNPIKSAGLGRQSSAYSRIASAGVLPASDSDVAFVASSEAEQASSLNRFNYERRMSLNAQTGLVGGEDGNGHKPERLSRHNSAMGGTGARGGGGGASAFSRCQTTVPAMSRPSAGGRASAGLLRPAGSPPTTTAVASLKKKTPSSSAVAFGRSQSTIVKATSTLATAIAPAARRKSAATTGGGVHAGYSLHPHGPNTSDDMYSPKPRTPLGVASKTKKPHEDADRFAAPTSFYNPSIMAALRQRSGSESNRPSTLAVTGGVKRAAQPPSPFSLKKTKTSLLSSGLHSNHSTSGAKGGATKTKTKTATKAKDTHAFEPTKSGVRSRLSVEDGLSARSTTTANCSSGASHAHNDVDDVPHVPQLNFSQLHR